MLLCSCQPTERDHSIATIEVDVISNAELKLSEYFENFRMLKLSSDSVMGIIHRIRYANNRIYISDRTYMFIFSDTGELLSCFTKRGRGPGEYSGITDFIVDGETIVVLDRSFRKLQTYSHSGEYISTHDLECWAQAVSPMVDHTCFLYYGTQYCENERYKLRRVKSGQEDSLYLAIDKHQANYLKIFSNHNFYQHQESIYFFETYNDTVYESIRGGSMNPFFCVDFQGKNIPASFFERDYTDILHFSQEFDKQLYAYGVVDFVVNDRFLMFGSYYQKNKKLTVFDRKDQISNTFATVKDDVYFNGLNFPLSKFSYHADNQIIVPINAFEAVEWRNSYPLSKQFEEIVNMTDEEDNPLLLIFDFRQ